MPPTLIRHRLTTPDGEPVRGRRLIARLIAPTGWLADTTGEILEAATATSGDDGWCTLKLTPQSQIAATGSYYEVRLDPGTTVRTIVVPDAGPVPLVSCLVDPTTLAPVTVPPASVFVLTGDPRLADARVPKSHAASHAADGTDPITPTALGALPATGGTITGDMDVLGRLTAAGVALPLLAPATRPTPYRDPSWLQTFQAGHGWTAAGSGTASSDLNSTAQVIKGTQSARITTTGTAAAAQLRRTGLATPLDLTGKMLRLTLRVDDATHLEHISFYAGTSALANTFRWTVNTHSLTTNQNWIQSGEWVVVTLSWADVVAATGTYTLSSTKVPSSTGGFTDLQLAVYDDGLGPVTCHLQSVEVIPSTSVTFPKGVVSITFDDSWQNVYDLAKPKMDALGYRGTQYTIADYVGSGATRLTLPELKTLSQFCGWEIGGHSFANAAHAARYTGLTARQVDDDLRNLRAWLVGNGFASDSFAYPGGQFSKTTDGVPIEGLVARYFGSARSILSDNFESYGAPMPFRMRSYTGITDQPGLGGITVSSMTAAGGALDRAANGGWLILCLHQIITGTPTDATQISQTGFTTLMDAIAARGIPVLPVGDVLRNYS